MAPPSSHSWAGLPPELVQLVCSKAEGECRLSMFDTMRFTCTAWRAAVLAAPHLVPVAMLELPAVDAGPQAQAQALRAAAALHPLTWHVVIKGASEKAQPLALTAVLAVLPSGVRHLEVQCDCAGLVLRMLRRFAQLDRLELGGNAAFADWRGAGPVASKLAGRLTLDCRRRGDSDNWLDEELTELPEGLPHALSHAAGLHSLALDCAFGDDKATAVCTVLALHTLSLTLRHGTGAEAEAAVAMLRQLPQLQSLELQLTNVATLFIADADGVSWIGNGAWEWVPALPLVGLPLHSLTVQGAAGLPPDWRQLASLQVLRVVSSPEYAEPWVDGGATSCLLWGCEPASALTALTRLELKAVVPAVEVVASLPALQLVRDIKGRSPPGWRAARAAARPDVTIIAS